MSTNRIVPVHRCPACGNWNTNFAGIFRRALAWPFRSRRWRRDAAQSGRCPLCGLPVKPAPHENKRDDGRIL